MDDALEQLVTPVYRFALRLATGDVHLAEDLTQETLVRALHASRHDLRRPPREDLDARRTWLFTIVANVWRDHLRRHQVRSAHARDLSVRTKLTQTAPEHDLARRETAAGALDELDRLPERQRQVLYLSACEGLSPAAIASVLGISRRAATASLSLARRRLSERLDHVTSERPA